LEKEEIEMNNENIATFNLLLTSAVAKLYQSHPATINLDPSLLWPANADNNNKQKSVADGTVDWLHRNGIVSGGVLESNGRTAAITNAQLTARGYQIANKSEDDAGGIPLGQVAIEAISDPTSHDGRAGIELVSRRFTES
jgi:hypothetical protein